MTERNRSKWLVVATLAAAALVVVLAVRNRSLRAANVALQTRSAQPYPGMFVPRVPAASVHGAPVVLGAPATRFQVLYFFSPTCAFCLASTPRINALANALPAEVELVGVGNGADDAIAAYASAQHFTFPVVAVREQRTHALFRANNVPLVMVLDFNGRVHHATLGAFDTDEELAAVLARVSSTTTTQPPGATR